MAKLGKKRLDAFNAKVEKMVLKMGGIRKSESRMEWHIQTEIGDLRISVHEPFEKNEAIFSIFTAFDKPKEALEFLKPLGLSGRLNECSGKFNFHISDEKDCLTTFEFIISMVLKCNEIEKKVVHS